MSVLYTNLNQGAQIEEEFIKKLLAMLQSLLKDYSFGEGEVGLILTTDQQVRELNAKYRDTDAVTDVLSFSYLEPGQENLESSDDKAVGDIYISLAQAGKQAEEAGHALNYEVACLSVHGMLHLLGFDHNDAASEQEMKQKKEGIMKLFE